MNRTDDLPMLADTRRWSVGSRLAQAVFWRRTDGGHSPREAVGAERTMLVFAAGLCVATLALVWLGYVATNEWKRGTDVILERRSAEALALAVAALNRDMKGAWTTVLVPMNELTIEEEPPYDVEQRVARAFARFPYPESFIIWKNTESPGGRTYVFNRAERRPHWDTQRESRDPFPVVLLNDPPALEDLVHTVRDLARRGEPFAVVETSMAGVPYHVVVHLMYTANSRMLTALAAFTVNLQWVREHYFAPVLRDVAKIGGDEETLSLRITDELGQIVAAIGPRPEGRDFQGHFPLVFLDPVLAARDPRLRAALVRQWMVHVQSSRDNPLVTAVRGTRRTFALITIAACVSVVALVMTVRAARANARLAAMKSDFVSAVTHELKTPLASIRLVGDTLARGRYSSTSTIQDYAELLSKGAERLSRSIDNLLTYARYTDLERGRAVETTFIDVLDLIEEALDPFRPILSELGFQVTVDIEPELPRVCGDRAALVQAVDNVIDNAIKYSATDKYLKITACKAANRVRIVFTDHGIGIPDADVSYVFDRFFRGRNATESGSGLGLAITRQILQYHGGDMTIRSSLSVGTEVTLSLKSTVET